jgi:hypothetical protein
MMLSGLSFCVKLLQFAHLRQRFSFLDSRQQRIYSSEGDNTISELELLYGSLIPCIMKLSSEYA